MAQVILLHGASSSGKSTLARALQARAPGLWWHLSIDHYRDSGALPMARFRRGELDWGAHRPEIFAGFHKSIAAIADAGNDVIVEHILDTDGWAGDLAHVLRRHRVLFVGLHCPLDVLNTREAQRGDRPCGSAAQDFAQVHRGLVYDLTLSGNAPPDENADRILSNLGPAHPPRGQR